MTVDVHEGECLTIEKVSSLCTSGDRAIADPRTEALTAVSRAVRFSTLREGYVFWDELFIFPFLNMRQPDLTRALLLYRYRRLPEARWAAAQAGLKGARGTSTPPSSSMCGSTSGPPATRIFA
jgi:trehalose/maltose hydrolase-like predicted phosphorylase